jgi:hypothetical protein
MSLLYGIIDAASDDRLYDCLRQESQQTCLFAGELAPEIQRASPHIVRLFQGSALLRLWDEEGWGRNWGIRCTSDSSLREVRKHFRHFLEVQMPDGKPVLFRFYDPRVWRVYLPTCTPRELAYWFTEVKEFVCEAADGRGMLYYSLWNGDLRVSDRSAIRFPGTGN